MAREVAPLRVAVVTASFPYRKQVEAFQEALRLRSVDDLRSEPGAFPRFLGLNVERRETAPTRNDWQPLDFTSPKSPLRDVATMTLRECEYESDEWKALQVSGLVMPLPVLARGRYPECSLPLLTRTLADPKARALPDYCLMRFLDVSVLPGRIYEYRVQVRMANPNHGKTTRVEKESLAEPKELLGPWARVPGAVEVGPELLYYAVDMKALDPKYPGAPARRNEVGFQIHRWIGLHELSGIRPLVFQVADWVVAERVLVSRGEYVGGPQKVKLPVWSPEKGEYVVAGKRGGGGVSVDFSPTGDPPGRAPLLVDFEGGKLAHKRVVAAAPVEVLMLSADGKLLARNSQADATDPLRRKRHDDWTKRLDEVTGKE
jgi:hypothetical protein